MKTCPNCEECSGIKVTDKNKNGETIYWCSHCGVDFGYNEDKDKYTYIE